MLNRLKREKSEGFTIIEVMIVLAIAGVIMIVVFLAIPALQRNSRNTQRKTDAGNLASSISEYSSNNQGKLPGAVADVTDNTKIGFYTTAANITWINPLVAASKPTTTTTDAGDKIWMYGKAKCSGNDVVAGTTRQAAVFFFIESQSGLTPQCLDV